MSSRNFSVEWHPHNNKRFLTNIHDIRVYDVISASDDLRSSELAGQYIDTIGSMRVHMVKLRADLPNVRCVSWNRSPSHPDTLAAGLSSGKTVIFSISSQDQDYVEFAPRFSRACNALSWNPVAHSRVAVGLDKVRGDFSVLVWDITRRMPRQRPAFSSVDEHSSSRSAVAEMGMSESSASLAWAPDHADLLAVGSGSKWLRLFDVRHGADLHAAQSVVAHSKAVMGVGFDPTNPYRLATHSSDGLVKFWDRRRMSEALFTLNTQSKSVRQLTWCPTREGILATLSGEDRLVRLWDIKETADGASPSLNKPCRTHAGASVLSNLSWHPLDDSLVLACSPDGRVDFLPLYDAIPVSWAPDGWFSFAKGTSAVTVPPLPGAVDSGQRMFRRAAMGYALSIRDNAKLAGAEFDDRVLTAVWAWMKRVQALRRVDKAIPLYGGMCPLLCGGKAGKSEKEAAGPFTWYHSAPRRAAQKMCGWKYRSLEAFIARLEAKKQFSRAAALAVFHLDLPRAMQSLMRASAAAAEARAAREKGEDAPPQSPGKESGDTAAAAAGGGAGGKHAPPSSSISPSPSASSPAAAGSSSTTSGTRRGKDRDRRRLAEEERAKLLREKEHAVGQAAKAKMAAASASLANADPTHFDLVAMALSGFDGASRGLWRRACLERKSRLTDPYLRVCFTFLGASGPGDFALVLQEDIRFGDRIAFACKYLDDAALDSYLTQTAASKVREGALDGLVLTGLTGEGVTLLEKYVDATSDVQTAALIVSHVMPSIGKDDPRLHRWIETYRAMLDRWGLWEERAKLDVARAPKTSIAPQIVARCYYCGMALTAGGGGSGKGSQAHGAHARAGAAKGSLVRACSSCGKALPLCAVCLIPMALPPPPPPPRQEREEPRDSEGLPAWWAVCLSCSHGGHSSHLADWFEEHDECPVAGCECNCCDI